MGHFVFGGTAESFSRAAAPGAPAATPEGPSVLVLAGAGSSLPVASAAHPAPPRRLICRLCILLTSFARFVIDRLFSTVELGSSSYSLATSPRADRRGPQIFLFHCVAFLLTFLTGSFAECYFFILTRSDLSVFFLYELWFWNRVQGLSD